MRFRTFVSCFGAFVVLSGAVSLRNATVAAAPVDDPMIVAGAGPGGGMLRAISAIDGSELVTGCRGARASPAASAWPRATSTATASPI